MVTPALPGMPAGPPAVTILGSASADAFGDNASNASNGVNRSNSGVLRTVNWVAGFSATGDGAIVREELVEAGVPVAQVNARLVRQHEEEVMLLHFRVWILLFSVTVCLATPAMFALLVWLLYAYFDGGDVPCNTPLQLWVLVVFCIVFYNFTFNRPTPRGSCVQRVICRWVRDPDEPQPMPLRVWIYNLCCIFATFAWNCIGLNWTSANSAAVDGKPLCTEAVPNLHNAVRTYATFNLVVTLFMYVNMFGFAQLLRFALRRGLLHTTNAAPKGSLEMNTLVVTLEDPVVQECASCSVCLEDFEATNPIVKTKTCGHVFHSQCLKGWLQVNRTCPLCRQDLGKAPSAAWS